MHLVDKVRAMRAEADGMVGMWQSWEGKNSILYHTELLSDVLIMAMTLAHYLHIWFLHGPSFQLIDAILFLDVRSLAFNLHAR